jgi:hypothetical protein
MPSFERLQHCSITIFFENFYLHNTLFFNDLALGVKTIFRFTVAPCNLFGTLLE